MTALIDQQGYRANVCIVLTNIRRQVLWAQRADGLGWQFPQGGVHVDETTLQAMYRELAEELGLQSTQVMVLWSIHKWLRYSFPANILPSSEMSSCVGQKQKWFLLGLQADDTSIDLNTFSPPEFTHWRWVDYHYPATAVAVFKRRVYQQAMGQFAEFFTAPDAVNYQDIRLKLDQAGNLYHFTDWSPAVAQYLAKQDNIVLSSVHWELVYLLRDYYANGGSKQPGQAEFALLAETIACELGAEKAQKEYLHILFPHGMQQYYRIAGVSCHY